MKYETMVKQYMVGGVFIDEKLRQGMIDDLKALGEQGFEIKAADHVGNHYEIFLQRAIVPRAPAKKKTAKKKTAKNKANFPHPPQS